MNVLSLFDGISCGQVALQRAGIPVTRYLASEIEKHAISVTQHNWPNTVQLGDVVKVREMAQVGLLPQIDLLMGGSPCQGFSNAGKGKGFADPRSRLFFEYVRIKALVKPRWFLLENVKMKKADMDMISWWLGVEPVFINSADFSAQNRQRYYWTNIPVAPWQDKGILLRDVLQHLPTDVAAYKVNRTPSREKMWSNGTGNGSQGTCKNITNSEKSNCLTTINDRWNNAGLIQFEDFCRYLTPVEYERLQTLNDNYTQIVPDSARYKALGNGWTVDVIAHILRGIVQ